MHMESEELLTIDQTAEYLQVTRAQIYLFFKRKVNPLPYIQVSEQTRRIDKKDLFLWLKKNKVEK